jgi:hypothetical protein
MPHNCISTKPSALRSRSKDQAIGEHSGERPKEKQSREEEAEGGQEEGLADGFAVCFNRPAGEA